MKNNLFRKTPEEVIFCILNIQFHRNKVQAQTVYIKINKIAYFKAITFLVIYKQNNFDLFLQGKRAKQ